MLAICEDCAKKYTIDESLIKGSKARFSCYECGHIIVVEKPEVQKAPPESPEPAEMTDEEAMAYIASLDTPEPDAAAREMQKNSGNSMPVLLVVAGIVAALGILAYLYLT